MFIVTVTEQLMMNKTLQWRFYLYRNNVNLLKLFLI